MTNQLFSCVKGGKYSDLISEQIKKAIFNGVFQPGDKLPSEKEMIAQFGVSRVPLREALRVLEYAGFIIKKQGVNGGAFISDLGFKPVFEALDSLFILSKTNLREVYETRSLLEPAIARLASQMADDDDLTRLRKIDGQTKKTLNDSDKHSFMAHIEFHQYLAKITQNYMFQILVNSCTSLITKHMEQIPLTGRRMKKISWFHGQIIKAMELKKHDEVYKLMEEHLRYNIKEFCL